MKVEQIALKQSLFIEQYVSGGAVTRFFDHPFHLQSYRAITEQVQRQSYEREALVRHLMDDYPYLRYSTQTNAHIEQLRDERTVAVVTGQQVGVLTGPLYTLYKAWTAIQLAKQQSNQLGCPVVPIFWLASEDHDIDEVNHLYALEREQWAKVVYKDAAKGKPMLDDRELDERFLTFVEHWLMMLGETGETKALKAVFREQLHGVTSYAEAFAKLLALFFNEDGLIILNAAHEAVRRIEVPYFERLVHNRAAINEAFKRQQALIQEAGYSCQLQIADDSAHIFWQQQHVRTLLKRDGAELVADRHYTEAQIIQHLNEHPVTFSNNVVTRPIMQQWLLPTIAYVAGPSELAYWAELQQVFATLNTPMPVVVPRMSATIIDRRTQRWLEQEQLTVADVFAGVIAERKAQLSVQVERHETERAFTTIVEEMRGKHRELIALAERTDRQLGSLAQGNWQRIAQQLSFMEQRFAKHYDEQLSVTARHLNFVEQMILPQGVPQERIVNAFYFVNEAGFTWWEQLKTFDTTDVSRHYIILL